MRKLASIGLGLGLLVACGDSKKTEDSGPPGPDAPPACATPIAGEIVRPRLIGQTPGPAMLATSPPGDPRLFVVEQSGLIRVFIDEDLQPEAFLDISNDIVAGGEQGLLGLAFHPQYATNGQFYVFYTLSNANVVARCTVSANPARADGCAPILSIPDFASNHNGGMIEFGIDGLLYIGTGDGGGSGDPQRVAQNTSNLLGKILRIDVNNKDSGKEYKVPADNPFGNEVWMYGLRNPWRWSFDTNGDIWIGDVGQGAIEEIDVLTPSEQRGANLGWSNFEGANCFRQGMCNAGNVVMPKVGHAASDGWHAIVGGQVYRGKCYPDLVGSYFYTDNERDRIMRAQLVNGTLMTQELVGTAPGSPASIHADSRGELYLTTAQTPGRIYHLEANP
ncbi:MAG: PQQ-dependent sugar dehydrogenase [Deltaproteobacteria bacterium]|nr:PQQ-dependent sugar dehydrogenase [Deltaproteobacteria bacterium]